LPGKTLSDFTPAADDSCLDSLEILPHFTLFPVWFHVRSTDLFLSSSHTTDNAGNASKTEMLAIVQNQKSW